MTKKLLNEIDRMKLMDQIRVDMVQRREDPKLINAISLAYVKARKKLRYDYIQDYIRQ